MRRGLSNYLGITRPSLSPSPSCIRTIRSPWRISFSKRALTLLILIATAFAGIATFGLHAASSHSLVQLDPGELGILVSLWVVTALAAPAIRRGSSWFVDTVVLRRPDFGQLARPSLAKHRSGTRYPICSPTRAICSRLP